MILYENDIKRMEETRDYILIHLDEELDRSSLSQKMGMSCATLDRHFYYCFKVTLARFIKSARMAEAVKLLNQQTLTISKISGLLGFKEVSHFSHAFTDYYGKPPLVYVKENQVKNGSVLLRDENSQKLDENLQKVDENSQTASTNS
jgi:AraC-like DNA-binding protein